MIQHQSPISGIDSYQGKYIATAGYDNRVILWDQKTKISLARGYHDHLANSCKFSNCGTLLVSAGSDHLARLWEVPSMKLLAVFYDHKDDVEKIVISSDGKHVATASRDNIVRLFASDGRLIRRYIGHEMDVISVAFSEDGKELISCGDDGTIRIWDIETGIEKNKLEFGDIETDTICIKDGVIYAGNDEGAISVIRNQEVAFNISVHKAGIKNITYDEQSDMVLSCSYDYNVMLWRPDKKEGLVLIEKIECPLEVWLRSSVIVNATTLAFGTFGSTYCNYYRDTKTWDLSAVKPTFGVNAVSAFNNQIVTIGDEGAIYLDGKKKVELGSLCNFLLPFDTFVLTGGQAGVIFNALTGEAIYKHHSPLNCGTSFQKEGREMAVIGTYTGEGIVLEIRNGVVLFVEEIKLHSNAIKGLASNDKTLFSVCATSACAFFDLVDFSVISRNLDAHDKIANGASVSRNGTFVSVSRDLKLRIWNTETFTSEVIETPHDHSLKCVAVGGKNDNLVGIGSYHGNTSIYNLKTKKWVWLKRFSTSGISSVYYDRGKEMFLFSSYDGKVYKLATKEFESPVMTLASL